MSAKLIAAVVATGLALAACQAAIPTPSPSPTQTPTSTPTLAPQATSTTSPPASESPASTVSGSTAKPTASPTAEPLPAGSAIDGTYQTSFTKKELADTPGIDPSEVNNENWGSWTMAFAFGRVVVTQTNALETTSGSGSFSLTGDAITLAFDDGETFGYHWRLDDAGLTFSRDDSLGLPAPTPFLVKPWARPANGRIAFNKHDTTDDTSAAFMVKPDGTGQVQFGGDLSCTNWLSDGKSVGCTAWLKSGARPAIASFGQGPSVVVLNPNPGAQRTLECGLFDDTRFICGAEPVDGGPPITDRGLYLVRSSDGVQIGQITSTPGGCGDTDVVPSPDRTAILFNRICGPDEHGTLYRVSVDGSGLKQLSPSDLRVADAFGVPPADWSPDGSFVAYGALVPAVDSTALFVVGADGTNMRQIVSTDVGTVTVDWSPDSSWIVFTSRFRSQPQVWRVRPDGSDLQKLASGSDGSDSVGPVWSPDGTKLLFARLLGQIASLWTMDADGGNQQKLVDLPNPESVGGYAWGPVPRN